jgi:hypothetical protein
MYVKAILVAAVAATTHSLYNNRCDKGLQIIRS